MRIISLIIVFLVLFSLEVNADMNDLLKFLLNSAIETDRYQSYHWHKGTYDNPVISPYYERVYEGNPLVAGTDRETFDKRVDVAKMLVNSLPHMIKNKNLANLAYLAITGAELYNVYQNNANSKKQGFPQYYYLQFPEIRF